MRGAGSLGARWPLPSEARPDRPRADVRLLARSGSYPAAFLWSAATHRIRSAPPTTTVR